MTAGKYLKCSCQQCGGRIEYPADAVGSTVDCPHCQRQTELLVEVPDHEPQPPSRFSIKWVAMGVLLLVFAVLGLLAPTLLKHLASKRSKPAPMITAQLEASPAPQRLMKDDFEVGAVSVERTGSLTHVTGSVRNVLGRQRFSVRVQVECLDAVGEVVSTTSDYISVIEPHSEWRYRALVLKGTPVRARLSGITEQR